MSSPKARSSRGLHDFVNRRSANARAPFRSRAAAESPSPSETYSDVSGVEVKQEMIDAPGLFDASSIEDSDSTLSRKQMEHHKLPVPLVGAAARRGGSDDLVMLDQKPDVFMRRDQLEETFSDGDEEGEEYDEASEMPGGYDINSDNGYGYVGEEGEGYEFDDESEKSENDEDTTQRVVVPPEPGLWDDTVQTLSSRGLFDHTTIENEAFVREPPPPQSERPQQKDFRMQKPVQNGKYCFSALLQILIDTDPQRIHSLPLRDNGMSRKVPPKPKEPAVFRPIAITRSLFTGAPSSAFSNPQSAPTNRPPGLNNGPSAAFVNPPLLQSPQPVQVRQHQTFEDIDRTIRPSTATSLSPATPPAITPLLTDTELKAIPTYTALLTHLQNSYASSRSSVPQNLESELSTLLAYSYPSNDIEKVRKFFTALPDNAYEAAGDIIVTRKRELEEKMREAGRKRRKVVGENVNNIRSVAEERMSRLEALREKRDGLRGGVGKLLRENGWTVEF
jgi:hypothetical protein